MSDETPSAKHPEGQSSADRAPREGPDFVDDVYREEIDYIRERRKAARHGKTKGLSSRPTTRNGVVGLAFSGGGIRSATFNLGVLQALQRWGLFKNVDLLSTVSGGGFIGSSLTSLMSGGADFPFDGETPAVKHLRNNSNYLAPRGPLDYLRMFAVLIRGIILNFLVLVPLLLIPCLIATLLYGPRLLSRLEYDETAERALAHLNSALITQRALEDESPMEIETTGGEPVQPLIELLKRRAFVPLAVAKDDLRITAALQERNSSYREVKEPLITGTGSDTAPSTFNRGVTLSDVTHRLVDAELLEADSKIKEIQIVELALRTGGLRLDLDRKKAKGKRELDAFFEDLEPYLPQPIRSTKSKSRQAERHCQPCLFMVFVTQGSLVEVLAEKGILERPKKAGPQQACKTEDGEHNLECWDFARDDKGNRLYSLTQVLQAFYDARLLDRRWLELHSRRTLYDHDVAYRWPNDEPSHLEIEAAARALWKSSGGAITSVEDLFRTLQAANPLDKARPLIRADFDEQQHALLAALWAGDIVKRPNQQAKTKSGVKRSGFRCGDKTNLPDQPLALGECEFTDATSLLRLPEALYEQGFYAPGWFDSRFNPEPKGHEKWGALRKSMHAVRQRLLAWIEAPYQVQYKRPESPENEEIEAAREALSLPAGATVTDLFDVIRKRDKKQIGPSLFPSATRLSDEEILQALQDAFVVETGDETCDVETLEGCFFQTAGSIESIPRLFYILEFYNRAWFEDYFQIRSAPDRKHVLAYGAERDWLLARIEDQLGTGVFGLSRPTVQDLFEFLEAQPSLLRKPSSSKRTTVQEAYKRLSKGHLTGKCPPLEEAFANLDSLAGCRFSEAGIDGALQELYDRGYFNPKHKYAKARGGSRLNQLYTQLSIEIKGYFAHHLRTRAERILWNPHELRVPLTALVAIAGLAWVLLFPVVVAVSGALERRGRGRTSRMERSFSVFMVVIAAIAFLELQPYLIYHWHYLDLSFNWTVILGLVSAVTALAAGPALAFFKKFGRQAVILLVSLLGPLLPFVIYLTVLNKIIYSEAWPTRDGYTLDIGYVLLFFLITAIVVHLLLLGLDPNSTSIHDFYRGRLSRAYLVGRREPGELLLSGDLKLSEMCRAETAAPYHLVNVALNLQGSDDPDYRDRNSDFFFFSKKFVGGGHHSGYCPTQEMEAAMPQLDLGTAMAISGAAAAPNMGAFTVGPLVILLALLNIRLGYWLPNPRRARESEQPVEAGRLRSAIRHLRRLPASLFGFYRLRPGPYLFLKELAGWMDDEGLYVNVSDGGHIENTAIFELLRRRCELIIAGDAEADPKMNFAGLATLVRYARLDLDIEIEIDTSELRLVDGSSSRHFAIGKIHYPAGPGLKAETGYLIYLKASVTGDEDQVVSEYRRRQSDFPHQSTADQFFDENQFEAYRALGSHVVDSLFKDLEGAKLPEPVLGWLQQSKPVSSSTKSDA